MAPNPALLARIAAEERGLAAVLSRLAGVLEGVDTPLIRLLNLSDDLALTYLRAERRYAIAFASADPASRQLAREGFEVLLGATSRLNQADAAQVERLLADRIQWLAGGPEALALRAEQLAGTAAERAAKRAERVARRWAGRDVLGAATRIEGALLDTLTAAATSARQESVLRYLSTVRPNDQRAWRAVAEKVAAQGRLEQKLATVRANGGLAAYGEADFVALLQSELGNVQGVLGEVWTWRSRPWLLREAQLRRTGLLRGRRLAAGGAEFRPVVIREPLLRGREEIYDGSVMLARPLASGPGVQVFEAHLHGTLQVQIREDVTLLDVAARDVERELERPGGLVLRTRDHTSTFIVRSAPDGQQPTRYIVAPNLDAAAGAVPPPGARVVFLPALPSRDQIADVAFVVFSSLL